MKMNMFRKREKCITVYRNNGQALEGKVLHSYREISNEILERTLHGFSNKEYISVCNRESVYKTIFNACSLR